MTAYIPIANLKTGQDYEQVFMLDSIEFNQKMKTHKQIPFAKCTLSDITGKISGTIWGYNETLEPGNYVKMKISTRIYDNKTSFTVQMQDIESVGTPINAFDYINVANPNLLNCYQIEVENEVLSIDDPIYRDIMGNAIQRLNFINALKESPYGLRGPMAYRGGLLVHVAHSMRFAKIAIAQAQELELLFSPSLVIAGCVLRNIGWHTTTCFYDDHLRTRDAYHMTGIYRASARYIDHLMLSCENDLQIQISESKKQALENICNKQAEILTIEGKIVACADNMADILDFAVASLQKKQNGSWNDGLFTAHL